MKTARSHVPATAAPETIVCLHASVSTSHQWRPLAHTLTNKNYRLIAPDFYGYGQGPTPTSNFSVHDEVELVLSSVSERVPFHLVGHSYGGAVALQVAKRAPERVRSLTLFEPAAFTYLKASQPAAFAEVEQVLGGMAHLFDEGEVVQAAKRFINYWLGMQTFENMPPYLQQTVVACMPKVRLELSGVLTDDTALADLGTLTVPTLLLAGSQATMAMRVLLDVLQQTLPTAELVELDGLGHMAPVTQPTAVNKQILNFLTVKSVESGLIIA